MYGNEVKHDLPSELWSTFTVVSLKSPVMSPISTSVVASSSTTVKIVSLSFPSVGIVVFMNVGVAVSAVVMSVVVVVVVVDVDMDVGVAVSVVVVFDGVVMYDIMVVGDDTIVKGMHPSD